MRYLMFFLLCLFSMISFGQSDLKIQANYVGNEFAPNYRKDFVRWNFEATNIGVTEASVVSYNVYLSDDNNLDPTDLLVHNGNLGDNNLIASSSGIDANTTVQVPSYLVTEEDFYIPWNYEANEQYYFIFEVEQDIANGETNISNNIAALPFYLSLQDNLQIIDVDFTDPLGNRTPLLLVHGWQPIGSPAEGNTSIWDNFLAYFNNDPDLIQNFKPYFVKYNSNIVPINDLGQELRIDLDNWFGTDYTGNISMIAHSMGGLVSRAFAKKNRDSGSYANDLGGERVNILITLGTPHHGSHLANGDIRINPLYVPYSVTPTILTISETLDYLLYFTPLPTSMDYNRWDLRWDNFNNFYSYPPDSNDSNEWLNSIYMNGDPNDYFDNKIIAYAGGIFEIRSPGTVSNSVFSRAYELGKVFLSNLTSNGYNHSDGIVPFNSAKFEGHPINKYRTMFNYYHDEMAKGRFDYVQNSGTDAALFGLIKADLLGNVANAIISSSFSNGNVYPNTVLGSINSKDITIQNTGDLDLIINTDDIQLIGIDNANFSFNFPTDSVPIPPNGKATFMVEFAPTSLGNKTITLRVNNSSVNNPQLDIQLSGLAVQTATTDYDTNTDPLYDFDNVYIYGGSAIKTLRVSNTSSAPYTVANINIVGVDADQFSIAQAPVLPKEFHPGDSDVVILSFNPNSLGEKNATIQASFQDNSILDTANLIGNGVNTISNPNAPKLNTYEIWYNNDYANKQSADLSGNNSNEVISFFADTNNVQKGLNTLNFRIKDENGSWSSVVSDYVYVLNNSTTNNQIVTYEYWFDDNYSNKTTGNTSSTNPYNFSLPNLLNNLEVGLHKFHIRFKDDKGAWSSISSDFIYNTNNNASGINHIVAYRYWFNDDFINHTYSTITPETLYLLESVDISGIPANSTNNIHFQFKDAYGNWSSILTEEFINMTLSSPENNIDILKLYPNPTSGFININTDLQAGRLTIYNNLGQIVQKYDKIPSSINMKDFDSGLYIFLIESENKMFEGKIIKL